MRAGRALVVIAGLSMVLVSVACSGGSDAATQATAATTPASAATEATRAPAATATVVPATATPEPTPVPEPTPTSEPPPPAPFPPQAAGPPAGARPPGAPGGPPGGGPPGGPRGGPPPAARPPGGPESVSLRAQLLAYSATSISVPAGVPVTVTLQNQDIAVGHDIVFNVPGTPKTENCAGPCTRSVSFTAPAAGSYSFYCTLHPVDMTGILSVTR